MSTLPHNLSALPELPEGFRYRLDLGPMATSRDLQRAPRHRWFYFLHSYSYRLVEEILDAWSVPPSATLVDNFAGSGTTLLTARMRSLVAYGYDLSPLAVTVSKAKTASYSANSLSEALGRIQAYDGECPAVDAYAERLRHAFSEAELRELGRILNAIRLESSAHRDFFLAAVLSTACTFTRAVADGGWLRWRSTPDRGNEVKGVFSQNVLQMLADVSDTRSLSKAPPASVSEADARALPLTSHSVDAVVTSPPYPNRHDYSRVFHIGLLLLGVCESDIKSLRYKSLRSHVEAKSPTGYDGALNDYVVPDSLKTVLESIPSDADNRIEPMIRGYFQDMYLSLREAARILRPGGRGAYVVGNVRHAGVVVPVDKIIAEMTDQLGLVFDYGWVMRLRGNSAQQMGQFGKEPSRESVVLFSKV